MLLEGSITYYTIVRQVGTAGTTTFYKKSPISHGFGRLSVRLSVRVGPWRNSDPTFKRQIKQFRRLRLPGKVNNLLANRERGHDNLYKENMTTILQ